MFVSRWIRPGVPLVVSLAGAACSREQGARQMPSAAATPSGQVPMREGAATGDGASALPLAPESTPPPAGSTTVPARTLPTKDGTFVAARFDDRGQPAAVKVRELPATLVPRDQASTGHVDPGNEDPGIALPISQLGMFEAKGTKHLVLVEARDRGTVDASTNAAGDVIPAPLVGWFSAEPPRLLAQRTGDAVQWRLWKGERLPAVVPEAMTLEAVGGRVLAARFLGAVHDVRAIFLDAAVPSFVVSILGNGSGIDDGIILSVVGYVGGELAELLSVDAGPRSSLSCVAARCEVLGPLGSVVATTEESRRKLRVRSVLQTADVPCTSAGMTLGCPAEERVYGWDPITQGLSKGPARRLTLRQSAPGEPVTVVP